jgi:hypothetical protein
MKRELLVFGASFGVALVLGGTSLRCSDDDCGCPPLLEVPPQVELSSVEITGVPDGDRLALSIQPENTRVSLAPDMVTIEYSQAGVDYVVRYAVRDE